MRVRVDQEVEKLAAAFGRPMRIGAGTITQDCPVCENAVTAYIHGAYADDGQLRAKLFRAYDEHECERLASLLFCSNSGLDELFGRIEMASVLLAARAAELVDTQLRERIELESRGLAARAKSLAWILRAGAPRAAST